jgi:Spy/CpxP family protein refolding chaperone
MRRFMSVALIGLAVAGTSSVAAAQANGQGRPDRASRASIREGAGRASFDSTRSRQIDSIRAQRGDSVRGVVRRGGRRGDVAMRGALAGIKLTDAQKTSMKEIHKKYGEQLKTLRQQNAGKAAGQNADARAQFQSITQRERADIRAILTPDQQAKFDANLAKKQAGKGRHGKGLTGRK